MACEFPMQGLKLCNGEVKIMPGGYSPTWVKSYDALDVREIIPIPCGKCLSCRLDYSRQWANRCMDELETTQGPSWFITLTYDNDHLPRNTIREEVSGVEVAVPTLKSVDLQLFMKRLRESFRRKGITDVRFFACGEYGEQGNRPHYHIICYNCPLDDLTFYKATRGLVYYNSKTIEDLWENKGFCVITDVTWESCAYVARYIMKKHNGKIDDKWYERNGADKEFIRMSRRPGIGRKFFELHKDEIYPRDVTRYKKGVAIKPAKYYDKLYEDFEPIIMDDLKERRRVQLERRHALLCSSTSLSVQDYNGVLARDRASKVKLLKREL